MKELEIEINKIKNIKKGKLSIPLRRGIYGIIGNNGTGKSTIMTCLAQVVFSHSLDALRDEDIVEESYVWLSDGEKTAKWHRQNDAWKSIEPPRKRVHYNGMYEGSLFYGTRFNDSKIVDDLLYMEKIDSRDIIEADDYIKDNLSYILHGNYNFYRTLKRIRNKRIAAILELENTPYFQEFRGKLVSQYRMSSGECLLISLLHFIYNAIVRRSLPQDQPIIMLIDEIELALHPIAVVRLLELLSELIKQHHNLVVILSSHSPEVIRIIQPNNLFQIELSKQEEGLIEVNTPCYPSYAIRDVYMHDGFDFVILVEDYLAKKIVQAIIDEKDISRSKLINILPVGGWSNVLNLQHELYIHSTFGAGTKIFSILDGDIKESVGQQYKDYPKLFIPIGSIEKFLKEVLVTNVNAQIKKEINDKFFNVKSVDNLIAEYVKTNKKKDEDGKELYKIIRVDFENRSIAEMTFVENICKIAKKYIDFSKFETNLEKFLKSE
ncbi:ATP-dependent nuclease [Anaerostipes sp.]|uniref:ATP-dependent nuclease n=1 Tax=Anaerostipes sp. TaxID=1872530 RepID=UPI0025BAAF77|nr:AAA family ATPase [Anaerostipes sp.]MBS7008784.1 AAA family ATPase [Anaerostipes sp.]